MTHAPAGADPAVLDPYLATALSDDRWSSCTVELIAGGKSNLTYRVDSAAGSAVLRRPPLGEPLIVSRPVPLHDPAPRVLDEVVAPQPVERLDREAEPPRIPPHDAVA